MRRAGLVAALGALAALGLLGAGDGVRVLDAFEDLSVWRAAPADGVALTLSAASRASGRALAMDFDFGGRGGYAAARRPIEVTFPENYEIAFDVRGRGSSNVLEIKFVDASGDNVWWIRRPDFTPPTEWTRLSFKRRHVRFAWGPLGQQEGGAPPLTRAAFLELVVAAAEGGAGRLEIDDLTLTALAPERPYTGPPSASAGASAPGHEATRALDGRAETAWRSGPAPHTRLDIDFGERRELGGLSLLWEPGRRARRFELRGSRDGKEWTRLSTISAGGGLRDELFLPETDVRFLRLDLQEPEGAQGFGLAEIEVRPLSAGESVNAFFLEAAKAAPRGAYPRGFSGEQVYWTVAGVDGDAEEVLVSEDGALEPGERSFSIEPFLWSEGKLWSWADVTSSQSLAEGHLPIPSVSWAGAPLTLEVTVVVEGAPGVATARARYRVTNASDRRRTGRLFLAVRPFLVNPPTQFLNVGGGAVAIRTIAGSPSSVDVDGRRTLRVETPAAAFGASPFEGGLLTEVLAQGRVPGPTRVDDAFGYASGALAWELDLPAGAGREI
ncbi:MAG TPA: discoidin domain-containing protein, partial [Thermoanaerobaculia bacterium]